jgi:AraC-like DNA-binding protein
LRLPPQQLIGRVLVEFVLDQRPQFGHRLLHHASGRTRKVSDIAFTVGFNDLSHFHRSFKKRFGVTLSDVQMDGARNDG